MLERDVQPRPSRGCSTRSSLRTPAPRRPVRTWRVIEDDREPPLPGGSPAGRTIPHRIAHAAVHDRDRRPTMPMTTRSSPASLQPLRRRTDCTPDAPARPPTHHQRDPNPKLARRESTHPPPSPNRHAAPAHTAPCPTPPPPPTARRRACSRYFTRPPHPERAPTQRRAEPLMPHRGTYSQPHRSQNRGPDATHRGPNGHGCRHPTLQ